MMNRTIEQILDLARWAPSGDNTQPWRFEIVADDHVIIHGFDTREHCVYDLTGHPSQMAVGALLETVRIAATGCGLKATVKRLDAPEARPTFDVRLTADPGIAPSTLMPFITARAVQRRAMRTRPLKPGEKRDLEASVGGDYMVVWLESWRQRLTAARLMFASAKIRLTIPEAFEVHRSVIEWNARFSPDRIPDQAVGLDALTIRLMRWAMQDWRRIKFLNTYLGGTLAPRIQLDFVPGLACAAHFAIVAHSAPSRVDDYIAAGRAMQRFWLTASQAGLYLQPEMTPLIFYGYVQEKRRFSSTPGTWERAERLAIRFQQLLGRENANRAVFFGRIGAGPPPRARSLRRPLHELMFGSDR